MLAELVEQQEEKEGSKLHRTINFSNNIPPLIDGIIELKDLRNPYH
jgi:hypothetical protein